MATDQEKERVREATDIVALVSRFVKLRKRGGSFVGLCPFHDEKTPSFNVHPDRQFFHCFGCGKGGDVFTFLMEHERWGFPETLEYLANKAGVTLTKARSPEKRRAKEHREQIADALARAQRFFAQAIFSERANEALAYLEKRGFDKDAVKRFGIGYAPDGWDALLSASRASGFPEDILEAAGLISRSEKDKRPYDRFRDRITFPIHDLTGRVIAFGARGLADDATPKYLNSPETEVYVKSNVLYGLHEARRAVADADEVLVVEGYMDWLALTAAGVENVVAVSGTAFTPAQAKQLRRFCARAVLLFDADAAGRKAAMRGVPILYDEGIDVRITILPEGEDPDSFVRVHGPEALRKLTAEALGVIDFRCRATVKGEASGGFLQREKLATELLEIAAGLTDRLRRSGFVGDIAAAVGLDPVRLEEKLRDIIRQRGAPTKAADPKTVSQPPLTLSRRWERDFLRWLLDTPDQIDRFRQELTTADFEDRLVARLFEGLLESTQSKDFTLVPSALARSDEELTRWTEIAAIPLESHDTADPAADYLARFQAFRHRAATLDLRRRIAEAEAVGDSELAGRLTAEYAKRG